jgi:hypothetical protein
MKARVCVCVSVMKIFMLMYMCKLIYGSHKSKKSVFLNHAQIYLFKQGFSLNLKHIHSSKPSEPAKPIRSSKPMSSRNPPPPQWNPALLSKAGLLMSVMMLSIYIGIMDSKSDPRTCPEGTLPTMSSYQAQAEFSIRH